MNLTVYVPQVGTRLDGMILPRSGIVGSRGDEWLARVGGHYLQPPEHDDVVIDYEGNRYGAVNMVTFADRVLHAAERHRDNASTSARLGVKRELLIAVGSFDFGERVEVSNGEALAAWLGTEDYDAELIRTGYGMRRGAERI